ncbi:MFS transporter [Paenibacillus methanolicus]|uniref:PPP family 3-phenylpropionic acid transporter n=1 Tax=Paenibacillus methanolicus TaxID=582686 RepID=A0A5S5BRI9_9BACL|nr:MFS transporter [Paenibacillus methanolicus]TYP69689.1 PPP family 3-phenylpropionic acid transporter [Paenibacillus methanolicus]
MMPVHVLRIYNFVYFSLFAIFLSFLPVYLSSIGLTKTEIGLLIGLGGFVGMVAQPMWGIISDRLRTVKKVLLLLILLSVIVGAVLFQSQQLMLLSGLVVLMYLFFMPTDPLMESLNVQISQQQGVAFGSIRMFGALGYAVASMIVGYAGEVGGRMSYVYLFVGYGTLTLLLGFLLPDAPVSAKVMRQSDLKAFLKARKTLLFFALILIISVPHRMNDIFIGLYVEHLGGSTVQVGYSWTVMTAAEVLFFALSGKLIKPGREMAVITLAAGCYAIRFLLSGLASTPEAVVWLQIMQGVSFVLFYGAAIQFLYRIIPEEWKATGQTLLAVLFFGISGVVGSTAGGWLFDRIGGEKVYLLMSAMAFAGVMFSLAVWRTVEEKPDSGTESRIKSKIGE